MKFLKEKEKQRFSLRKYKAYGLSSALLGLTLVEVNAVTPVSSLVGSFVNSGVVAQAAEPTWRPEGRVVDSYNPQYGTDVPWELYENGYLLFKPTPGHDTIKNYVTNHTEYSWSLGSNKKDEVKAIGFEGKTYAPEDASKMFSDMPNLESFDGRNFDTSRMTNAYRLFYASYNKSKLTYLNASNWDVSSLQNARDMFYGLTELPVLDVSRWNVVKLSDAGYMFKGMQSVTILDTSGWRPKSLSDTHGMFYGVSSVRRLDAIGWDVSHVRNFAQMYYGMTALEYLNMPNWTPPIYGSVDETGVDVDSMFGNTPSLKRLNMDGFRIDRFSGVSTGPGFDYAFVGSGLRSLDFSNWAISRAGTKPGAPFMNMSRLVRLVLPGTDTGYTDLNFYESTLAPASLDGYEDLWYEESNPSETKTFRQIFEGYGERGREVWLRVATEPYFNIEFDEDSVGSKLEDQQVHRDTDVQLPTPTKQNFTFKGWSKTENGEIITNARNLTEAGQWVTLYAVWDQTREEVIEEDVPVPVTTTYTENNQLAYGNNPTQSNGKAGVKHVRKVYTLVNGQRSGEPKVTETVTTQMQPKVVQVGTKPTVVETPIARKTVYQGDITAATGTVNESEAGLDGKTITTTTYTFNAQNGTATPNEPTTTTKPAVNKVVKKGTKPKVEYVMNNGVKVRKTTNYTVNSETGVVTESVSYTLLKSTDLSSTDDALATGNTWEKRERLTDQAVPIEKITTYTMRPENGEVTTSVRYEIVDGQGAKKDTLDTTEDVTGNEVPVVKKGHHVLNTETGKLTSTIQYARKDGQANVWETTEPFNTDGVFGNKITKHTLNPSTGDITNEVRYEIDKSTAIKAIETKATAKNKEIDEAGLLPEDVTVLKQQVEAEKTKAIDNVNKANAVEDVITKRDEGITAIGNISLDAAKQRKVDKDKSDLAFALQTAKNNALKELEAAAKAKVDEIENADILLEDKDALKQRVASEKEKATKAINEATDTQGVTAKLNDGKTAIAGIGLDEAKQRKADKDKADLTKSLEQAKLDAVKAIEAKATAKNKEIDEAGLLPEDVTALKQQVEAEKTKAIDNVNKANTVEDVTMKRDEGITAIGNISLDAAKQRKADSGKVLALQTAKNNALTELEAVAKAKVDEIENADILLEDKDALKQRVASEKAKATKSINEATTPEGVTVKLNDGKTAIAGIGLSTRQDSGNKVAPLVREELPAYHGSIEDIIEEFESNGVKVRQITKYVVNEDGTVSSKVEYRFENGKSEFDQVEEMEEQGIKIRKIIHYVIDENGEVSSTVRYELLDGSLEFDKVENVKDELGLIERTTHYKLNSEMGKFETTVSDKRVTTNSGKELPPVPQKQLPNTGDMSIVTSVAGIVTMGIGALARPKRKK